MVEFLTLFLSLVSGPQPVAVAVTPAVASVEIVLDADVAATLAGPPWSGVVDFGPGLRPHRVEAVAFDRSGRELGRSTQLVNVPRPPVEARLAIDRDSAGRPVAARVVWESRADVQPKSVELWLDQTRLDLDHEGRATLPHLDHDEAHLVSVEAHFPDNAVATTQALLGGRFGSEVRTELTAVPLHTVDGAEPALADVRRGLRVDGRETEVVALEKPGPRVVAVVDPSAFTMLRRLGWMIDARRLRGFPSDLLTDVDMVGAKDGLLYLVHPQPDLRNVRSEERAIFPIFGPLTLERQPLPWVVAHARLESLPRTSLRIADAVGVAAVAAAGPSRPRAVLLVLGQSPADGGLYRPREIREYLERMQVPLVVWSASDQPPPEGWGWYSEVSSPRELHEASERLQETLDRQWIAWIDGRYLPTQIELSGPARTFEIAR